MHAGNAKKCVLYANVSEFTSQKKPKPHYVHVHTDAIEYESHRNIPRNTIAIHVYTCMCTGIQLLKAGANGVATELAECSVRLCVSCVCVRNYERENGRRREEKRERE